MKQNAKPTRSIPAQRPRKKDRGGPNEVPIGKLVVIYGNPVGREYRLGPRRMLIGRTAQCDVTIGDSSASRRHAIIESKDGRFLLQDLKSTNGTFVNGQFIDVHVLSQGDKICVGWTVLQFLGEEIILTVN